MFCSNCGTKIGEDWKVCPNCGMPVENKQRETAEKDSDIPAEAHEQESIRLEEKAEYLNITQSAVNLEMTGSSKPKKRKKLFILGAVAALCALLLIIFIFAGNDEKKELVQTGYLGEYDTVEIQKVMEWYAPDGEWGEGEAKTGNHYIVEYATDKFIIQFTLDEDEKGFRVTALENEGQNIPEAADVKIALDGIYERYLSEFPNAGIEIDTEFKTDTLEGHLGPVKKVSGKNTKNNLAKLDFKELIDIEEKELKKFGLKQSDEYLGYGALGGDVQVSCGDDGKVELIMISNDETHTPSLYGVRIGMTEKEAYSKLKEKYPEVEEDADRKLFLNIEEKESVSYEVKDGKVNMLMYMKLSEDLLELYNDEVAAEYIFPDSDKKYLSEDEVRSVEADKLYIGRNEIFARHGYIFKDDGLNQHFKGTSWYEGVVTGDQFDTDAILNDFEKKNAELIKKVENEINEPSKEELEKQAAIDGAYNFVAGRRFHLQDAQRMIEFTTTGEFIYSLTSYTNASTTYSITARYEIYKDDVYEWLVFMNIDGVEYYFRYFNNGTFNLAGNGDFDGWYEVI